MSISVVNVLSNRKLGYEFIFAELAVERWADKGVGFMA